MKKGIMILIFFVSFLVLAGIVFESHFVSAENNVCCEKLKTNQWCQSAPLSSCDTSINPSTGQEYQHAPTSCESTFFCSTGTCYNSQEGVCNPGVTESVCQNSGGVWSNKPASELPQCQLGCCTLGDGASFVTQSSCKQLSSLHGLKTNFNPGIKSELKCIESAGGDEKGACTFEKGSERTCKLLTRSDCNALKGDAKNLNVVFYKGLLCSNENLGTNCGPTKQTTCVEGQNEVYFVDSCGNLANIYDASKINDKSYWAKIIPKKDSCGSGSSNANSPTCGNCDTTLGSVCSAYKRGETSKPKYGGNICKDLSCEYKGKKYKQGESWCASASGVPSVTDQNLNGNYKFDGRYSSPNLEKENLPGSVYAKLTCYDGKVSIDNCYDGRQKVCVQSDVNGFKNAACKLNSWQSCYFQKNEADCMNREKRDCIWTQGGYTEQLGLKWTSGTQKGYCTPIFPPGFDLWNDSGNGEYFCSLGSIACHYRITETGFGHKSVADGAECINIDSTIKSQWINAMQKRCNQIGDCGPKNNYLGFPGEDGRDSFYKKVIAK